MRTPVWTVAVLLGAAISSACPGVASLFVYDRVAVLQGEAWRLVTSHLVHFDGWHFAYDFLAFGIAGALVEPRGRRHLCGVFTTSAVSICAFLLLARPEMTAYGGLSGVTCAVFAYLALSGLGEARPWRTVCGAALVVLAIKIGIESASGGSLLPAPSSPLVVPVWEAHAIGCGVATLYFGLPRLLATAGGRTRSGSPFCKKTRARRASSGSRTMGAVSESEGTHDLRRLKDTAAGAAR
jgi:rhomboid family GlyGly-CTERM serine protease